MYQWETVVGCVGERINFVLFKCYVLWGKGISGFTEKSNGCSVVWGVRDHVRVTC
jgi:hypothetical protein